MSTLSMFAEAQIAPIWHFGFGYVRSIDPSHKSHNAIDKYHTMHLLCVHISATKWCIVVYGTAALWYLCKRSIYLVFYGRSRIPLRLLSDQLQFWNTQSVKRSLYGWVITHHCCTWMELRIHVIIPMLVLLIYVSKGVSFAFIMFLDGQDKYKILRFYKRQLSTWIC